MIQNFSFHTTPQLHFGQGSLERLPQELNQWNPHSILLVSDPGVLKAGITAKVETLIVDAGYRVTIFSEVEPDPRIETAEACANAARSCKADVIIGVGGGSAMDIAKVAAVLAYSKQPIHSMFGIEQVNAAGLALILVPTTAGTGSEVTHIAILSDEQEHLKKGIVSKFLFPRLAIVDPLLTLGVPAAVTAASGMDALLHAVEAFTSKNANDLSDTLARRAMRLISENLRDAYQNGQNLEARTGMLEGSMLAGMAFANAGVTAVHAFAYPIGAEFHIPHGVANSIMMGPVLTFNISGNPAKFAEVAECISEKIDGTSVQDRAELSVAIMKQLAHDIDIPKNLSSFGVRKEHIPNLADGVLKVTRLLANNPRAITRDDAIALYTEVL
jgi:alcohol dehydrogenase class IV